MFLRLDCQDQARTLARLIEFHAEHRTEDTRIHIEEAHSADERPYFAGCISFSTERASANGHGFTRSDRILVAPDGTELHLR